MVGKTKLNSLLILILLFVFAVSQLSSLNVVSEIGNQYNLETDSNQLLESTILNGSQTAQRNLTDYSLQSSFNPEVIHTQSFTQHVPISIASEADLIALSLPGTGSSKDPYVISNLNITNSATTLISISGITSYVVVRDNLLNGTGSSNKIMALSSVTTVTVLNNTVVGTGNNGIGIISSSNLQVVNNTLVDIGGQGIRIDASQNVTVSGNSLINNLNTGLFLNGGQANKVTGNYFESVSNYAISVIGTHYNLISDNVITNSNAIGIYLFGSNYTKIIGNDIDIPNTVDDGIYIHQNQQNTTIAFNSIHGGRIGIFVTPVNSDNSTIISNVLNATYVSGIQVYGSNNRVMFNSILNNVGSNLIYDGSISSFTAYNYYGSLAGIDANNDRIFDNPFSVGTTSDPTPLTDFQAPVQLTVIDNSDTIYENLAGQFLKLNMNGSYFGNYDYSIEGGSVTSGTYTNHTVTIPLDGASSGQLIKVTVYILDFSFNFEFGITELDTTAPLISSPSDMTICENSEGVTITWYVSDNHPSTYMILRNESQFDSGSWTTGIVSIDVNSSLAGTFVYEILITDTSANNASDQVIVSIIPEATGEVTTTETVTQSQTETVTSTITENQHRTDSTGSASDTSSTPAPIFMIAITIIALPVLIRKSSFK